MTFVHPYDDPRVIAGQGTATLELHDQAGPLDMLLVPCGGGGLLSGSAVAACGVKVPMISGRGLGHTGGTLDKLEAIPGFTVNIDDARFHDLVRDVGACLIGQTGELAPADKKLYALRDVTATVDCIPLITSSIMSKKLAEGLNGLVLDIKIGSGAFMKDVESGTELARTMVGIGRSHDTPVVGLLTDMDQPLGTEVGNANEMAESIAVLRGDGPPDTTELTFRLGEEMLILGGVAEDPAEARRRLESAVETGSGLEVLAKVVETQGGDPSVLEDPSRLPSAENTSEFTMGLTI